MADVTVTPLENPIPDANALQTGSDEVFLPHGSKQCPPSTFLKYKVEPRSHHLNHAEDNIKHSNQHNIGQSDLFIRPIASTF